MGYIHCMYVLHDIVYTVAIIDCLIVCLCTCMYMYMYILIGTVFPPSPEAP